MAFANSVSRYARRQVRKWLGIQHLLPGKPPEPENTVAKTSRGSRFSLAAVADLAFHLGQGMKAPETWTKPTEPHWLEGWRRQEGGTNRTLAMDSVPFDQMADYAASSSPWSEGLGFMGYAYLAELQQRPEYRRLCEIWAAECTRKWVRLKGGTPERIAKLEVQMRKFNVRERFREAIELDCASGRSHIYMDFGEGPTNVSGPLMHDATTIGVGTLKNLKVEEAYWTYPQLFNSTNPLAGDFYAPSQWLVMGFTVHNSRMLTFVGREVPDILKPVYMFGGLSLTQMVKPYVDSFIRNRTSVGNLLHSFSTMVLATDLSTMLSPEGAGELVRRVQSFVYGRDNGGLMMVDKATEELTNVAAPLAGVKDLLGQSQEMICSMAGLAKVVYLGEGASGLNASSEGEIKAMYGHVKGYQEKTCQGPLDVILRVLQLDLDGKVDESIVAEFVDLWELDEEAKARVRAANASTDAAYIAAGVLDPDDVRERLKHEEGGLYQGVELKAPPEPDPEDYDDEGDGATVPNSKPDQSEKDAGEL